MILFFGCFQLFRKLHPYEIKQLQTSTFQKVDLDPTHWKRIFLYLKMLLNMVFIWIFHTVQIYLNIKHWNFLWMRDQDGLCCMNFEVKIHLVPWVIRLLVILCITARESYGGTRLLRRGDIHVDTHINAFVRIRCKVIDMATGLPIGGQSEKRQIAFFGE